MTARHQVEAAIARLEALAEHKRGYKMYPTADSHIAASAQVSILTDAITILRAECAEILRGDET